MDADITAIQVILVFLVTFIAAIDQFNFLESLYQPIVMGPIIGAIMGDVQTGLIVGGTYQLMTIGNMPVGGAQPPNPVIGGIMATVLAISLGLEPNAAVAAAIPFSLLGQYAVTTIFTIMSPVMAYADKAAHEADPKKIAWINYGAMGFLGLVFGIIVTLFFVGGATFGSTVVNAIPAWLMSGLSAAGGMMRFVGFAILLKVMISGEMWGFYFMGFALANLLASIPQLSGSALLLLALIGFAFAYWDYQNQTAVKSAAAAGGFGGGDEDGI
ncbi:MAG: PTS sugar transporter subunit IIC [Symbiobacterium sp.]|uniref:PTS mannose/fructose/sorbose/N-acetylgalactosamine transporter subunit IIC n=1 Tax=Symbiobacterium sp. TaxID=1971213 RepID=UPI0034642170